MSMITQCECDCQFSSEEAFYEWFYEKYPHKSGGASEWVEKKKNKHYWGFRDSDGEYGVFNTNAPCCGWCKEEDIGLCGSCKIQLDHLRDGTEEDGHRCHNCYWTEEGLDKGVELITPDYRNKNTI